MCDTACCQFLSHQAMHVDAVAKNGICISSLTVKVKKEHTLNTLISGADISVFTLLTWTEFLVAANKIELQSHNIEKPCLGYEVKIWKFGIGRNRLPYL